MLIFLVLLNIVYLERTWHQGIDYDASAHQAPNQWNQ